MENGRKDVIIQKGGDHRDLPHTAVGSGTADVRATALPAQDQPFLLQQLQGVPHGLAAHMIPLGKLRLGCQAVVALAKQLLQFTAQDPRKLLVFFRHCDPSFPGKWVQVPQVVFIISDNFQKCSFFSFGFLWFFRRLFEESPRDMAEEAKPGRKKRKLSIFFRTDLPFGEACVQVAKRLCTGNRAASK